MLTGEAGGHTAGFSRSSNNDIMQATGTAKANKPRHIGLHEAFFPNPVGRSITIWTTTSLA